MSFGQEQSFSFEASQQAFMQRVYTWMTAGLALTGFVSFITVNNVELLKFAFNMRWILFIVQIGLIFWLSSQITKISPQTATLGFFAYAGLNGLALAPICLVYTGASIATTFFVTAGTFAGVSLYGWTTKANLTSMRGFLMMGLIGMIIASVVNIFLQSPVLYWIMSYVGVAVAIGLTAYDTQQLKAIHEHNPDAPHQIAIMGALKLYLDFILLFVYLLRILGSRR